MEWRGIAGRIAVGDESAVAELYDATGRELFSVALAVLGDATDAEDAVERCLLRIVRLAPRLRSDTNLGPLAQTLLAADLRASVAHARTMNGVEPLLVAAPG